MSKVIFKKVIINCDEEKAFSHFTENNLLEKWLCDKADVKAEIGGKYELSWHDSCGPDNGTFGCIITAFEPNKLIAFDWKGANIHKDTMNIADPLTHVTVSFIPLYEADNKQTEIILVHSGWKNTEEWELARVWFERAWEFAFKALKEAN